jgi:putative tryptophan/tyrosine transport system substrate-binding protein
VNRGRRALLRLAGGSAILAAGGAAAAPARKRLAVLHPMLDQPNDKEAFARLFESFGFRAGENLEIEWYEFPVRSDWNETLRPLVARMVASAPDCIHTSGELWMRYALEGTHTIPIVGVVGESDPVQLGFAQSLARPGGNVTGVHLGARELHLKRLELLRRFVPKASTVAWISFKAQLIWYPTFEDAARQLGLKVRQVVSPVPANPGFGAFMAAEFSQIRREDCRAAHLYSGVPEMVDAVRALALSHRVALSHAGGPRGDVAKDGILFNFGGVLQTGGYSNQLRSLAMVARILRGEHPGNIPFEGPAGYELRVNARTAERIGVAVPSDVQLMASELIR